MSSGVLIPPGQIRVRGATKPVDFRKAMDGLAALVKEQLRADQVLGRDLLFPRQAADRVKLVFWHGTGLCLFAKRLEDGKFPVALHLFRINTMGNIKSNHMRACTVENILAVALPWCLTQRRYNALFADQERCALASNANARRFDLRCRPSFRQGYRILFGEGLPSRCN